MGKIRHNAIIVTSHDAELLAGVRAFAQSTLREKVHGIHNDPGALVTDIGRYSVNSGGSFAILPDGSKEGWGTSDEANDARRMIMDYIDGLAYDDGSTSLHYVEVQFAGDNDEETSLVRSASSGTPKFHLNVRLDDPSAF